MKLQYIATESGKSGCPTLFAVADDANWYVVQGHRIEDEEALATMRELGLPDHETAVRVPKALLEHFVRTLPRERVQELLEQPLRATQ